MLPSNPTWAHNKLFNKKCDAKKVLIFCWCFRNGGGGESKWDSSESHKKSPIGEIPPEMSWDAIFRHKATVLKKTKFRAKERRTRRKFR